MSAVPGTNAKHAIITPTCRRSRGNDGAFNEAVERLRHEYEEVLEARGEDFAHYHLVLSVEPKTATERLRNLEEALSESAGDRS